MPVHVGGIYSCETFYDERADLGEQLMRHGVLCVEMEAAELYTLAARYGRRALAVLTISDHLVTQEALPADQLTAMRSAIQTAENSQLSKGRAKLQSLARSLKENASTANSAVDGKRMQALAEILQRPAK